MMNNKFIYRVLHAPTTVGGHAQGLSQALNKIGVHSKTLCFEQNYFNYSSDIVLWKKSENVFIKEAKKIYVIIKALFFYEIIHYNFGKTIAAPSFLSKSSSGLFKNLIKRVYYFYLNFLQIVELHLFKVAGKCIFMTYQGDDARQGDFLKANFDINIATQVDDKYYEPISDEWKRKSIYRISNYCSQIYALNPDLLNVLPEKTKFLPYANINLEHWRYCPPTLEQGKPIKICHAPSNRKVKGTNYILNTINELKKNGYIFNFVLIEGLSNDDAKLYYETADVFIDQLFAGWYGGVAVEAMALGKPVLSYIREKDLEKIPTEMINDLPIINVNINTLYSELVKIITMPRSKLKHLSLRSRTFVEKWHDPMRIAQHVNLDYQMAFSKVNK
jgi:hypothetical protein